jgi:tRNA A-37 threonylcarbamoyl transferase component Bud32
MGRVWMARDEMLDRDVAVKEFVPPAWMTDAERDRLRTRTLREARSAARLNHPNVVRIYDVVHAEDLPWIVMEYVPSRSLHQVVGEDGPLSAEQAAPIGLAVLDALTAAHTAGVLHRDVKPHNVLIGHDGRVVLTDFGTATFVDDGAVTGPGMVVGSPQYVSPERARDGASTVESDLWSFGATLYAAIEGRSPYARENAMATLTALATEPPDPPVRAGPLTPVLTGLLRRDPAARITAVEARAALRRVAPAAEIPFPRTASGRATAPVRPDAAAGRVGIPSPRPAADDRTAAPNDRTAATDSGAQSSGAQSSGARGSRAPAAWNAAGSRAAPAAVAAPATDPGAGPGAGRGAGLGAALAAALPGRVGVHDRIAQAPPPSDVAAPAAPHPGDAAPGRRPQRFRLVLAGVALAAVLGGGGLFVGWLTQRDSPAAPPVADGQPTSAPTSALSSAPTSALSPSPSADGAAGGFSPVACAAPAPAGLPRTPVPGTPGKLPGGYALPPQWSYHADASGFFIAVPDGWTYQKIGATLCFREPGGTRVLSLDTARKPSADPVAACRAEARRLTAAGVLPGYSEVAISRVPYVPKAADWEYRYADADGTPLHATTRWFASGGRAYALGWVTREFDWQTNRSYLTMIQASFTA